MSDYLTLVMEKDIEKTNNQGEFKFRNQNPGAYSVIMMRSKRSFVWNHYTIEKAEDGKSSFSSSSTIFTNLFTFRL
jgi:hypothetical protein